MATCSVIVPCYNGARFLPETLRSVLNQSRRPDEIIVIDDGSTDGSAAIAESIGAPVRVIRQANQGESVARNLGMRAASGDYLLFLDADDLLAPDAIARFDAAVSARPGSVGLGGTASFTDDPDTPFERWVPDCQAFFPTILQTNFGPPHCLYPPRALALRVGGFREDLINSEDWDFWGRIALTGAALAPTGYEGARYRRHGNSQVATTPKPAILEGRLTVGETLAAGVLQTPDLLERFGDVMFWSLWAMLRQARQGGVRRQSLGRAERLLQELARRGPASLRRSPFVATVRYLGTATANRLRDLATAMETRK